ncbi:AbrB/MazE/SpoVT family DNA-binding domain-containing protein [Paenibacillus sp. FSL R7-0312]|uniref:AbrB/MazE/SpoVT family DNA-binding domain-containing protein n=1 Tax=Paenibacillus sp. FSL R7-0312 TaxID=2921682 RepID=UPI0030FD172A
MTTITICKWGNSLAVRIPQNVAEQLNLKDGTKVEMIVRGNIEVVIRNTFPAAEDQEALREHFLALRARSIPGMVNHKEIFADPEGDEVI